MSEEKRSLLAAVLKWLDERESYRLTKLTEGSDSSVLGYPGLAAEMLRNYEAMVSTEPAREPSPGLKEILEWLDSEESSYQVANEHVIGAPLVGRNGRAAKLLRYFHTNWALAKSGTVVLKQRVLLGHLPSLHDSVEIACKDGHDVRLVRAVGTYREPDPVEWQIRVVDKLWYVGAHDEPAFSVIGSPFIHTSEGFLKTWRFVANPKP